MSELAKIKESVKFIQDKFGADFKPKAGIVLGSGLGGLVKELDIEVSLPYGEIPNFPVSTVEGHAGNLLKAKLGGKDVIVMQGRFHYYEGYTMNQVVLPHNCPRQSRAIFVKAMRSETSKYYYFCRSIVELKKRSDNQSWKP